MYSPIISSTSYPTVSVAVTHRLNQEDRIELMRFLFTGPTRSVGGGGQEDIGALDYDFEGDSQVSIPGLVADSEDSFCWLEDMEQGKEVAVEETVEDAQGEDDISQAPDIGSSEDAEDDEDEWIVPPVQGAPPLSVKSLTLYRQLGEGGFGRVYAASLRRSEKLHAVKIIPKTGENQDQVSREQDLLRRLLGCSFFSQLEASWESNLNYYLVTPIYPGNLRDEIDDADGLPMDVAHFYIKQIAAGVEYLHSHYILHRDLKSENILLTQDGHTVICDFGLATIVRPDGRARRSFEEDPQYTLPGFYIESQSYCYGTPQSTAPEVVFGESYGLPSDLWSLGVIIYEMITNRAPWGEEREDIATLYNRITSTDPDLVPSEWVGDAGLCSIVNRLLRKDPSRRPSINELLVSRTFEESGGWGSVRDYSKPGPIVPGQFSRGRKLKAFWPGYKRERDQTTDAVPSFTFTDSGILEEIEEQRAALSAVKPIGVLQRTKGQIISRVRPLLTRINTSDLPPTIPEAESEPRLSSAASFSSIDIPDVEDLPHLLHAGQKESPKVEEDSFVNPFPSFANFYSDQNINPFSSPELTEAVHLVAPPLFSQASSRLPSSEATSVYSSERYFSSTESLGDIAPSNSTTPLVGLETSGRAPSKNKRKVRYGAEGKLFGWVRGLWRRGFGGLLS